MLEIKDIKKFIDDDRASKRKQKAQEGVRYYEGEHDIKDYRVFYYDEDGQAVEDHVRSNERISHPFLTELIDQCTQYLLSGDTDYVRSDDAILQKLLNEYFNEDFKMELNDLLTYTGVEGFSYLYRYVNENMKTRFKFADGLNVVEVPSKYASDEKDHVIYYYFYKKVKDKDIYKVEVHDAENVYFYEMLDGKIKLDDTVEINPRPHVIYSEDKQKYFTTFGSIPFIRLDNNRKQFSDLKIVKNLIDDYDLMSCGLSNNIQDSAEGFFVVKGFESNDMDELTQNLKVKKRIGVGENGDVDVKTVNIPYEARKIKLELDEKNIYRFGMGFDSSKAETSNVTNVVIKSRYALLDLKANKKEMQLKRMLNKVIEIVLDEINHDNDTAYELSDVYIQFDRIVPSNELDNANIELIEANKRNVEITTLLNVATKLDDETLLKNICDVLDIDYEEIKDKLPQDTETLAEAKQTLLEA